MPRRPMTAGAVLLAGLSLLTACASTTVARAPAAKGVPEGSSGPESGGHGTLSLGFISSQARGKVIEVAGQRFGYDDIWRGGYGFGPQMQARLHLPVSRGDWTELTLGPGLMWESAGYGTEGGTGRIQLRDGTLLRPQFGSLARLLATLHVQCVLPLGFFAGAHAGFGAAWTSEVGVDVIDPGGVETRKTLFKRTTTTTGDLGLRVGWRYALEEVGFGFFVEMGWGIVGAPSRGTFTGADPDPIHLTRLGVAFHVEFGSLLPTKG